jgi:hypothetical protein
MVPLKTSHVQLPEAVITTDWSGPSVTPLLVKPVPPKPGPVGPLVAGTVSDVDAEADAGIATNARTATTATRELRNITRPLFNAVKATNSDTTAASARRDRAAAHEPPRHNIRITPIIKRPAAALAASITTRTYQADTALGEQPTAPA